MQKNIASSDTGNVDARALEGALRAAVRGEVRFGDGDRALYSTDSSNYRQIPIGVVIPRDRSDVIATVAACRKFGAPITCRGGGTSLAGQCCNVAVIIDFTKYMNRVLEIDVERKLARAGTSIIVVTHHLPDIIPEIGRVVLIKKGRVLRDGSKSEALTSESLSELFETRVELVERAGLYQIW